MDRKVERILFEMRSQPRAVKVAAYSRVSCGKDAMLHSLSAQVCYYSNLIQSHEGWIFCGVYADEALTGTKENREQFQELLNKCRNGEIDMIITKSISRFARNTVTLLQTVRELKSIGVDIFFEEQNIHTISTEGELMLTILASYAQEESLSASENQKWRIKKNFEDGIPWNVIMYGYRNKNETFIIEPNEAEIVKRIYAEYLSGKGKLAIVKSLSEDGVLGRYGIAWTESGIANVLRNYNYTGNLLLQKTFRENHLTKKTIKNQGVLPQYHATNTHEAIIDFDTFNQVQEEIARRADKYKTQHVAKGTYLFSGLIICDACGKHYRRKNKSKRIVWICSTYNTLGKNHCPSKSIPEETLTKLTAEVLGIETLDDGIFHSKITAIRAKDDNTLVFCFKDGTETVKQWQDRSRAESWTDEMKSTARQRAIENLKTKFDNTTYI